MQKFSWKFTWCKCIILVEDWRCKEVLENRVEKSCKNHFIYLMLQMTSKAISNFYNTCILIAPSGLIFNVYFSYWKFRHEILPPCTYLTLGSETASNDCCKNCLDWKEDNYLISSKSTNPDHKKLHWSFKNSFSHEVVPMSPNNSVALAYCYQEIGWNHDCTEWKGNGSNWLLQCHLLPQLWKPWECPSNGHPKWGSFDKKKSFKPFIEQVAPALNKLARRRHISKWDMT